MYHDAEQARRTNKIDFLQLPWAQKVHGSNLRAPTTLKIFPPLAEDTSRRSGEPKFQAMTIHPKAAPEFDRAEYG
jgi:hypothetical protein